MTRTSLYTALPLLFALATPVFASVTVSSPGNGAEVSSPFNLSASSSSCSSQTVSAMGFSLDSSTDTTIVDNTSVNASVSASTGAHTLHVKSWGTGGAACVTDVAITVTGTAAASAPSVATNSVSVSSPANGSSVVSPFVLTAAASTCSSQPVSAMGYSLDSSANTSIVDSKSVGATVSATAGSHVLHVKAWGNGGAACDTDVNINVTVPTSSVSSSSTVAVSSPSNGATVSSPFDVTASAGSCSSQQVSAMGYSLDNSSDTTIIDSTSLNAAVSAASGAHTLHVKAWGNQGASCDTDVALTVSGGSSSTSSSSSALSIVPSSAVSVSSIQSLSSWKAVNDSATGGWSSGTMSMVGSPSLSGHAREFYTQYSGSGGERYEDSFGDDTTSTNFLYDGWVYIKSPSTDVANVEMDMNQTMANGQTVIFGFQCDGYSGTWDYTVNKGSASSPVDTWLHTGASCNPRNWSTNTWHHVQVNYSRDTSGNVSYKTVWLDGVAQSLNANGYSAFALGWGPTLLTNFQVDGVGSSGSSTIYLDNLTVYRW